MVLPVFETFLVSFSVCLVGLKFIIIASPSASIGGVDLYRRFEPQIAHTSSAQVLAYDTILVAQKMKANHHLKP